MTAVGVDGVNRIETQSKSSFETEAEERMWPCGSRATLH